MIPMRDRMIEKAAKDICRRAHIRQYGEKDWRPGELDVKVGQYWHHYVPDAESVADAILAVLREPTEGMLEAGMELAAVDLASEFTAMIDHIRKPL